MKRLADLTYVELLDRARRYLMRHPGHSPQSVHGGHKHGPRQALMDATTVAQVNGVAFREATRITGRSIPFTMDGDTDLNIARGHAEGVLQGLERFPKAKLTYVSDFDPDGSIYKGHGYDNVFAVATKGSYGGSIRFNRQMAADPDLYHRNLVMSSKGHLIDATPEGIARHEFGHVLAFQTGASAEASKMATTMAAEHGTRRSTFVGGEISRYAMTNRHELLAEAFADVMARGGDASALSHKIFNEIERRYNR